MSLSKGNITRNRPQRYQNRTTFKNDLHDTSKKTKILNSLQISGVCDRCKEIIEWKIKYKKYKSLTAPKKCVGCEQKAIRHAYHIFCSKCSSEKNVCAKCCKSLLVTEIDNDKQSSETDVQDVIKNLSERKRRSLLRSIKKADGNTVEIEKIIAEMSKFDMDDGDDDSFGSSGSEEDLCNEDRN